MSASSAHNEFIGGETYTDEFDVFSADEHQTSVTINILGTNDTAVLTADVRNLTETNSAADISTSGQLTISDVDAGEAHFETQNNAAGHTASFRSARMAPGPIRRIPPTTSSSAGRPIPTCSTWSAPTALTPR